MKVNRKYYLNFIVVFFFIVFACKDNSDSSQLDSILKGELTIYVDENIASIVEEQIEIFETQYDAKVSIIALPESQIVNSLLQDSASVAILTRKLFENEQTHFDNKKIPGKITHFGFDAIVLISNKKSNDTIVDYNEIEKLFKNQSNSLKGMVFDNPNSSIVKFFERKFETNVNNNDKVFSMKNQEGVVKYISENPDYIGLIALDNYLQPSQEMKQFMQNIRMLNVKILNSDKNVFEVYNTDKEYLAGNKYPFRRPLYMLNYQGRAGLGMGFASFIAGDIGQRIIDRAGLLPVRIPPREIIVRDEIIKK